MSLFQLTFDVFQILLLVEILVAFWQWYDFDHWIQLDDFFGFFHNEKIYSNIFNLINKFKMYNYDK